ncbi:putative SprT family Zn-dependent metalloprotease [Bacillus tianshenii]|uniref:SprT family Zn-dependent metalloprotease n=2 Tax=Sutcliffiella tianshenii TaxID=1463404 RepID=A0ABS2NZR7_9BACI|nr:putative SprT family Zn-dependent metalloprotease [Bacillus tianshenii]
MSSVFVENYKELTKKEFEEQVEKIAFGFVRDITLPPIKFYSSGSIGFCKGNVVIKDNEMEFIPGELGFKETLLDGKTYSLNQINEVIIHELAHLIANQVHRTDCGHDERFMKIVELMEGNQSEYLSLTSIDINLNIEPTSKQPSYFNFLCSKCDTLLYSTNSSGNGLFKYFLFVQDEHPLPLVLGTFEDTRSKCCNAKIDFSFKYSTLNRALRKDDETKYYADKIDDFIDNLKAL